MNIPQLSQSTTRARAQAGQRSRAKPDSQAETAANATSPRRDPGYDFARLEAAVAALVEAQQQALLRNDELRGELDEKNQRIRQLESKLMDVNQRRQDVAKRIEELIAQIDQLEAQSDAPDLLDAPDVLVEPGGPTTEASG